MLASTLIVAFPVLWLTPSNTTTIVDVGTVAPPEPPLVKDQLAVFDQLAADCPTQYRSPTGLKFQLVLLPESKLAPAAFSVFPKEALESFTSTSEIFWLEPLNFTYHVVPSVVDRSVSPCQVRVFVT